MKILLLYPPTPDTFWSFKHVLPFVSKRATLPPLGLLTVAAMLPADWQLKLVDLNTTQLRDRDLRWADYVMLSAMIVHKPAVPNIVARCRQFAKPIIAGGPLFTTDHGSFPDIAHFALGEAEEIIPEIVEDLRCGTLKPTYQASGRPDITRVPSPRWDLINMGHYVTMAVQFSRGCPYDCEFCDIPIMNGHVPRAKSPGQFIAELEQLRLLGWRHMVFIVDDNFIGNKKQTKALLHEIIQWRARTRAQMGFFTEASANLADDPELCELMVRAGFQKVFVGIETPSAESLKECRKYQNCRRDLVAMVQTIQKAGLQVMGGFIVGFDNDSTDIFKRQFDFIQRSGVVTAMVGLLTALPQTPLYKRLHREGRLESETTGNNTEAALNFQPRLSRKYLINGYRDLMKKLYEPSAYYQRIRTFLKCHKTHSTGFGCSLSDFEAFLKSMWVLGVWNRGRFAYWRFCLTSFFRGPRQFHTAMEMAIMGYHFRRVASRL